MNQNENPKIEATREKNNPFRHYYGDTVRQIFSIVALVMLVTAPVFQHFTLEPVHLSVFAVVILVCLSRFMSPQQKLTRATSFPVSLVGLFIFGQEAIGSHLVSPWTFEGVTIVIAVLFLFALYFSAKTVRILFSNTVMSPVWLLVRMYLGWQWLVAGWEKVTSAAWTGASVGSALGGFVQGALAGAHPDIATWYASFLQNVILPHLRGRSLFVAYGKLLVGVALIFGIVTGIATFFGLLTNLNYLFAGTVNVNPILFTLSIFIILAWKIAGHLGVDRCLLPFLGTSWKPGQLFQQK